MLVLEFTKRSFKNHCVYDEGVIVKTTPGIIRFPEALIMQQFEDTDLATGNALLRIVISFKPSGRVS
jgi:hypothetical protein